MTQKATLMMSPRRSTLCCFFIIASPIGFDLAYLEIGTIAHLTYGLIMSAPRPSRQAKRAQLKAP